MKIKYVHISNPSVEKVYDTTRGLRGCEGLLSNLGSFPSQEEWDRSELFNFERDRQRGLILQYEIVEEGE
jgi:hypothetical protein